MSSLSFSSASEVSATGIVNESPNSSSPTTLATMTSTTQLTTTTSTYTRFSILISVTRSTTTSCSSNIYKGLDGSFTAWDPDYGSTYDRYATTCQPTEVTSWFDQAPAATIPTALGSSTGIWFSCPYAYSTVTPPEPTATANNAAGNLDPNLVLCCPSGYFYNTTATVSDYRPGYFPSQCYSLVGARETLRYMTLNGRSAAAESTVVAPDVTLVVQGIPVNGFTGSPNSGASSPGSHSSSRTPPQQLAAYMGFTFVLLFALAVFLGIGRRQKHRLGRGMPNHVEASRPPQPPSNVAAPRGGQVRHGARDSPEDEAPPPYKP